VFRIVLSLGCQQTLSTFAAKRRAAAPILSAGDCYRGHQQQTRRAPLLMLSIDGTDR